MPIYEYRCKACEEVIEVIQRFGDRPLRKCQKCSGRLEKLISRTAFHLKGGGWYAEGYSKSGSAKPDKPAKKDSSSSKKDSSSSKKSSSDSGSKSS